MSALPCIGVTLDRRAAQAAEVRRRSSPVCGRASSSSSDRAGQQPPHRAPAPQRAATSWIVVAPEAMAAFTVRSLTAWHEQTITECSEGDRRCS